MHRCLKTLLIVLVALTQVVHGSHAAQRSGVEHAETRGNVAGLQLAQYQPRGDELWLQLAQNDKRVDVEPPLIEHDVVGESEADIRQTFVATVVDDEELDTVLLYYRYVGETNFSRYVMMPVSYSSTYIAQIPTDPKSLKGIEYYIQARDTNGNRTVRGYTFSPLVRNIVPASNSAERVEATAAQGADSAAQGGAFTMPKAAYIVGGVLLLGLLASVAGGSGGGSEGGACGVEGCQLVVVVDRPF